MYLNWRLEAHRRDASHPGALIILLPFHGSPTCRAPWFRSAGTPTGSELPRALLLGRERVVVGVGQGRVQGLPRVRARGSASTTIVTKEVSAPVPAAKENDTQ